jgi:hypothetical protein
MRYKSYNEKTIYILIFYREDEQKYYNIGFTEKKSFTDKWVKEDYNRSYATLLEVS